MELSYYSEVRRNLDVKIPTVNDLAPAIVNHLKKATDVIKNEGKEGFRAFYEAHKEDFEGFAWFVYDHRGVYDRQRFLYNWQTLTPYVEAIFKLGLKAPHRERFIELINRYDLVIYALDDKDVVRFALSNLTFYIESNMFISTVEGKNCRLIEQMYEELKKYADTPYSPQWCLYVVLKKYLD